MNGRNLVVVAALVAFAVGGALVLESARSGPGTGAVPGSVYDPGPEGLSLAFRYLEERARDAGTPPPAALVRRSREAVLPEGGVLFRIRPTRTALRPRRDADDDERPLLTPDEESWVRGGGRLVLGLDGGYGPVEVGDPTDDATLRKALPVWPGVTRLRSREGYPLEGPAVDEGLTLLVSDRAVVATRHDLGLGEVVVLGLPDLFQNDRLDAEHHLRLLERLAGDGPVLFDEWAHGLEPPDSLIHRLAAWGFGPALVLGAFAFGLTLWRGQARLGPADPDPPDPRSEAVDLVESLGQLYERALSRRDAARLHVQGFERAVSLRTGTTGEALARRVGELLGGTPEPLPPGEIPAAELARRLARINEGYRRLQEHGKARRRP